ncbi:T9SS type A sorting domain-containing protein [Flavobacterium sp. UBA7682]|uniref:T9SS type A sorting domain-containing protein n=1 Tax=Flavobacterium sp. UBA7682 TaxID=1946560 RepID=UPI0025BBF468|nr:T9SS type A sorting domain-containing protein [Flavobacterium sp. UBA7682]
MKQKLLFLFLLSFSLVIAKPNKTVDGPAIGLKMTGGFGGGPSSIQFSFYIKNIGTETLTNIYITEAPGTSPITYYFTPIASLAPGEEISYLYGHKDAMCYDVSQTIVHATTTGGSEITDLSSDPFQYETVNGNFSYGSYYNDIPTSSYYQDYITGVSQNGTYYDLNSNNIVDVGDVINYTYLFQGFVNPIFYDDNAIISDMIYSSGQVSATGIHYITQAEINMGYVYNSSHVIYQSQCWGSTYLEFEDESVCYSCPNPNNANIITKISNLQPHKISGNIKFNNNNDNCNTGINLPQRRVDTSDGTYNYTTYTNTSGDYHIIIPNMYGNYTTTATTNLNPNFTSNPISIATTTYNSGVPVNYNNNDFCFSAITDFADLSVSMHNSNEAIPGNTAGYYISFWNNGTTNLSGSIQLTFDGGKLTFANATPSQNNATTNTLTWNYTNLQPFEHHNIHLTLNVLTPPTVNINDLLNFTVVSNPIVGDNTPANNTFSWNQTVRSSFDPNDKTVIEGAYITTAEANNYLTYLTRFQNSGTANATTVVIKETLDTDLDWNTFEPIASSHEANIQIRTGNDLTYTFSNIDLPYESANEPASHGWMVYRIKPKSNFAIGDVASSKSDIYFDYNSPIITNTVTTQMVALSITDNVKGNFALYPNPTSSYFTIAMQTEMNAQYQIFDLNGKHLESNTVVSLKPIDISAFQSGFYFVTINTELGKATYKLVKN